MDKVTETRGGARRGAGRPALRGETTTIAVRVPVAVKHRAEELKAAGYSLARIAEETIMNYKED